MLQKNQQLICQVENFGSEAEGVCRPDGRVLFVPGALPGESIKALVVKAEKRLAYGKLLECLSPSPERREPPCPQYQYCGACSCQHMSPELSLQFKTDKVRDCLKHIAGLEVEVLPTFSMKNPWRYRNKTAMPLEVDRDGVLQCGYYAPRSHRLIPVSDCLISSEQSTLANQIVLNWMRCNQIPVYQEGGPDGLRHLITRVNAEGETMITLAVSGRKIPLLDTLVNDLKHGLPHYHSLYLSIQDKGGNLILGDSYEKIDGDRALFETLNGLQFRVSPLSFFQVNHEICEELYRAALDELHILPDERVIDLYCGAGTLTLLAAQQCKEAIGIELNPSAIKDAEENARLNQINNVRFLEGAAENLLPRLSDQGLRADRVILDPPRKGLHQAVLDALIRVRPKSIAYISCNPATQARDAKFLCENGYKIRFCRPFDMFAQTADVENLILFDYNQ